ncbi:hypothetical protein VTO42DRAFT_375 [Malbranchea cinnamomea]
MDLEESLAVYIDDRVDEECWIGKEDINPPEGTSGTFSPLGSSPELKQNIELLASAFKRVHLCNSGRSFATKLAELSDPDEAASTPVFGFIDIGGTGDVEQLYRRSVSQGLPQSSQTHPPEKPLRRSLTFSSESDELFGLHLLSRISSDIQVREEPNVIVPIAVLRTSDEADGGGSLAAQESREETTAQKRAAGMLGRRKVQRCLDAGAVDVLASPLDQSTLDRLAVHAYRSLKSAEKERSRFLANRKLRKQSWVGAKDEKPYAYLREAMVSKLMKRICNPEEVIEDIPPCEVVIPEERKRQIEAEVAKWQFCAHDFTDDELVFAASSMIEHALQLPELEHLRISTEEIQAFVLSSRAAYNSFVLYHNFRHAVDVLQSTFHFLVQIGVLPEYPRGNEVRKPCNDIASLLNPFAALGLLITAIGHDVGHPGVNNFFLVKLNAPLAQLYNDKSVLEAFHCAAFSQILRRHWPSAFQDTGMRALMISSILATDMGVHNQFMEGMAKIREEYYSSRGRGQKWEPQDPDACRTLLCALLIKCADIGNVARHWSVAEKWADILQLEFANQGEMERQIGMETALFGGPPDLEDLVKKAHGQMAFMKIFALPLFDGVAELLPEMAFAANEIRRNQLNWQRLIDREKAKELAIESRPTEEEIAKEEARGGYYTRHSDTSPESWKEPSNIPQYDGFRKEGCDQTFSCASEEEDSQGCAPLYPRPVTGTSVSSGADERHKEENQDCKPEACTGSSSCGSGHRCEKRRSLGHKQLQRSSGRGSTTHHHNGPAGGVRTQSTSTYTNNTVVTPMSSTTRASSVISADSSYDDNSTGEVADRHAMKSSCSDSAIYEAEGGGTDISSTCGGDRQRGECNQKCNSGKTANFVTHLLDRSFNSGSDHNLFLKNPTPNLPHDDDQLDPSSISPPVSQSSPKSGHATGRTISRRRSRLRLAFWKRSKQQFTSPPPADHHKG